MTSEKLLNKIALFVQDLIKDKPMKYNEVRDKVMNEFNLSKMKTGNALGLLDKRGNFLSLKFAYKSLFNGILYLPDNSNEARKMFREIRETIPSYIRYANRKLRLQLLSETRKIKLKNQELPIDLLVDVLVWKLKISKWLAKSLIGELESQN